MRTSDSDYSFIRALLWLALAGVVAIAAGAAWIVWWLLS